MFGLLLLLLLVGIPLAGFWVSGYLHRPLPLEEPVLVEVAPGSSFNGLLAGMRADGLLGEPPEARLRRWSARLYSAFTGVDARLHVGEYQLNPGDSLGEMALVDRQPRSATVRAAEDTTLIVLTRKGVEQLRKRSPHAVSLIMENIARLLCLHLRRTSSQLAQFKLPVG